MAAESVKSKQISKPTTKLNNPRKPRIMVTKITKPTETQRKVLTVKRSNPNLTTREIGTLTDCSHVTVIKTLQRYGINQTELKEWQNNKADILSGLQHKLLISITDDDIKKAPLGSRVLAAAQLFDKERLEKGQSTANISTLITQLEGLQRVQVEGNSEPINIHQETQSNV